MKTRYHSVPTLPTIKSLFWLLTLFSSLIACQNHSGTSSTTSASSEALVQRGRVVFQTNCTACHNPNPRKPGSVGPDIYGSSKALIEARVLHADYPPDYRAKRMTHVMTALPHLKNDIDALHAYLNAP